MHRPDEDEAGRMPPIDLSLAVNYLPAVSCLLKSLLLISILAVVRVQYVFSAFAILAMLLNIDKVVSSERIFNGNAVLYMILVSWGLNYLRTTMDPVPAFMFSVSLCWSMLSLAMLMELKCIKPFLVSHYSSHSSHHSHNYSADQENAGVRKSSSGCRGVQRVVPTALNMLFMGSITFLYAEDEPASIKIARSLAFCLLCTAWVYIVGVWQRCAAPMQGIFTQNMLTRFCPVLFLCSYCALVFTVACILGLIGLYIEIHGGGAGWVRRLSNGSSGRPGERGTEGPSEKVPLSQRVSDEADIGQTEFETLEHYGVYESQHILPRLTTPKGSYGLLVNGCDIEEESAVGLSSDFNKFDTVCKTIKEEETEEDIEAYFRSACKEHMAAAK